MNTKQLLRIGLLLLQGNTKRFTENSHRLKTQGNYTIIQYNCDQCDYKATEKRTLKMRIESLQEGLGRCAENQNGNF